MWLALHGDSYRDIFFRNLIRAFSRYLPVFTLFDLRVESALLLCGVDTVSVVLTETAFAQFYRSGVDRSSDKATVFFESLSSYPARFSRHRLLFVAFQSIPFVLCASLFWDSEILLMKRAMLATAACMTGAAFEYGSAFIRSNNSVSSAITRLHEQRSLSESSRLHSRRSGFGKYDVEIREALSLFFILSPMIFLQWAALVALHFTSTDILVGAFVGVTLSGKLPLFLIWREFRGGSAKRMDHLVFQDADRSRFESLGEMSALIVHDLVQPFQAIQYCSERLSEERLGSSSSLYIERLSVNVAQVMDLVKSLKARLKTEGANSNASKLMEAHAHVIRVLRTQYSSVEFEKIRFEFGADVDRVSVAIKRMDLIHILDNLYKNSIFNLLSNQVAAPRIRVEACFTRRNQVRIRVMDNGTGLNAVRFEEMTSLYHIAAPGEHSSDGLGLRLIRRLAEMNRGSLFVEEFPPAHFSTCFCLTLPVSGEQTREVESEVMLSV